MITMESLSWEAFKTLVEDKKLPIQYEDKGAYYDLYLAEASSFMWHYSILKDNETECSDFEDNYKDNCNQPIEIKSEVGKPARIAPSAQPKDTASFWVGDKIEISSSETSGYCEFAFDDIIYLQGGNIVCTDAENGDYIKAQVLLKSNDAVVKTFVDTIYIVKNIIFQCRSDETANLPDAAKLRITYYKADGSENSRFASVICEVCKADGVSRT